MTMVPYDPFRHLNAMKNNFDRFFNELPSHFEQDHNIGGIRVDLHENETEITATCDLPGLENKEDVTIDIENNMLNITGQINRSSEINEGNMHRRERYVGSFHRTISLPNKVSEDGIKATYKNGVLEIRMPKITQQNKKKIDVDFH